MSRHVHTVHRISTGACLNKGGGGTVNMAQYCLDPRVTE